MQLARLLENVPTVGVSGDPSISVRGVAYDSRAIEPGFLFAALRGQRKDGNEFVPQAIARGAVAVL
ncbi:MAG TPA: Mur ligase domain-containing protein, partial [Candidatus Polarisedimenticolia bacterium]|nr:Mur ligase domain-containing protein [Candidatus Polarisedimenticolia bacterium]